MRGDFWACFFQELSHEMLGASGTPVDRDQHAGLFERVAILLGSPGVCHETTTCQFAAGRFGGSVFRRILGLRAIDRFQASLPCLALEVLAKGLEVGEKRAL